MISEICEIFKKDGFDIKIGNGIIISKNGFNYSMEGSKFIEMCEALSETDYSILEKDNLINGSKRTYTNIK